MPIMRMLSAGESPWLDGAMEWAWHDPVRLPEPVVPYTRAAIEAIGRGRAYTELG